jgi:acetyltransferase-like isoleucine patch superfamily enzyme
MSKDTVLTHDWYPRPLPPNVVIGERSWVYSSFAFLNYRSCRPCGLRVGHDSGIYNGCMFDLGLDGEVEIGSYCTIAGAIVSSNRRIVIGDYALVSLQVVIADSFVAVPADSARGLSRDPHSAMEIGVVVGENAWIGARVVLLAGARIGEGAIVGAGTVVDFEVPPYAIVAGNPGRFVGQVRPRVEETAGDRSTCGLVIGQTDPRD